MSGPAMRGDAPSNAHDPTRLQVLDVRPDIAAGEHPLDKVEAAAGALAEGGVLELLAPFEPRPLVQRMRDAGLEVRAWAEGPREWVVHIARGGLPALANLVDLEPPGPMETALAAVARLKPGEIYLARLPRHPALLLPQLARRGADFAVAARPDGTTLLWVRTKT